MRARADWTERVLAIKGEMKTNGHMIGQGWDTNERLVGKVAVWTMTNDKSFPQSGHPPTERIIGLLDWMADSSTALPLSISHTHTHTHTHTLFQ